MRFPYPTLFSLFLVLASALGATAESNWTDKSPHKTGFIRVNGVRLHYLDWGGNAETMLFLHGLGDTPHSFDDLAPKFTNQFRVLALTRRGHGQSDKPETGYDTATLVEDIRQFLDVLKIERVVLAGHSIAGDELSRFAVVHPDRVLKLVYFDSAYDRIRMPEILRFQTLPPGLNPTETETKSLDGMRAFTKRINNAWSEAWEATLRDEFSSDGKAFLNPVEKSRAIHLIMEGSHDSPAQYAKIKAPALSFFVLGYNKIIDLARTLPDPERKNAEEFLKTLRQFQEGEIDHFRKEIPDGRVVVFTNADHHCFIEKEAEVVREMREFLGASEWTDRSPHKSELVSVNNVRLHYLDWGGKGETMLFLHGLGDTPHIFDDLAPKFTNQFRVLGLARRGHGQSEIPEAGYDTATLVEDIRQFLDTLKIQRVVLVGHSIAGDELTRLAVVHPDRVIKLVYLDAAYDRTRMPEIMKQQPPELMPTKTESESLNGMRRWTKRMNNAWSEAWEATLREHFSSDGKILPDTAKRGRAVNLVAEGSLKSYADYAKVRVPALNFAVIEFSSKLLDFVKTLPDPDRKMVEAFLNSCLLYMQQETEHFRREIPDGRVIVFTNTDHHCFIQREDEVVREMRRFLAR